MADQAQSWEMLLARLFVDAELRARFERDPQSVAREFGLEGSSLPALADADMLGLHLAAKSYSHKRARAGARKRVFTFSRIVASLRSALFRSSR